MRNRLGLGVAALVVGCGGGQLDASRGAEPPPLPAPEVEVAPAAAAEAPEEEDAAALEARRAREVALSEMLGTCDDEGECFGALIGEEIGDDLGAGGLGLGGTGSGASGLGTGRVGESGGIGLGRMGSIGHGRGSGSTSYGGSKPKVRLGEVAPAGTLPKEVIGRIVRARLGQVKHCYEQALLQDPARAGKITVFFVIDAEGAVASAKVESSDLGDSAMESCVVNVFQRMSFPKPESGSVAVRYPLVFAPSN